MGYDTIPYEKRMKENIRNYTLSNTKCNYKKISLPRYGQYKNVSQILSGGVGRGQH